MSTWCAEWPALLAAVGVLVAPGLVVSLASGLRGIPALSLAPPLSVTAIAVSAVVAGRAGVPFSIGVVGVAVVVLGGGIAALLALARRLGVRLVEPGTGGVAEAAGLLGAVVGGLCAAVAVMRGIGRPDAFPQTFDAVFHLNAVWHAVQTGDASSLTLGTVAAPERAAGFYPAAWHDVTVLVAQLGGAGVVTSASAVSVAIAAVVWPLGCVLLLRQVVGARAGVLLAGGVLSAAFGATPHLLLSYGTLWPNALATVLVPAVLACTVTVLHVPGPDTDLDAARASLGRFRAAVLVLVVLPGLALAHPNALLSSALLATVVALVSGWRWVRPAGTGAVRRSVVAAGATALVVAELWLVVSSPVFDVTRATSWPARQTLAQAAGEWLLAAPMRTPVPWLAAGLVLAGVVAAWTRPALRWLVQAHAAAGAAFVLVAGSDGPVSRALSGPWYDDPFRLAALVGVTAVPLAAIGLERIVLAGTVLLGRRREHLRQPAVAVAALVLVAATGGVYTASNSRVVATWYGGHDMLGPAETALLERLPDLVPEGGIVAGNPWNGSVLAAPLGDRTSLYPHLQGSWGADRTLVAAHLSAAGRDPEVCPAVRRLGLGYVLSGPVSFWKGDWRQARYRGLDVSAARGFEPVARGGRLTLYRVTAC